MENRKNKPVDFLIEKGIDMMDQIVRENADDFFNVLKDNINNKIKGKLKPLKE